MRDGCASEYLESKNVSVHSDRSLTTMMPSGNRYACQARKRAPPKRPSAPTPEKFGGCGTMRRMAAATPARMAMPSANGWWGDGDSFSRDGLSELMVIGPVQKTFDGFILRAARGVSNGL